MGFASLLKSIDPEKAGLTVIDEDKLMILHRELLLLITAFKDFCFKADVKWGLGGGSMLGAARHQGFIPWDDDIDIIMSREEFNKLYVYMNNNCECDYFLSVPGDKNYILHFPRFYKKGTVYRELQSTDKSINALFLDIFIFENTPNNYFLRKLHGLKCNLFCGIVSAVRINACKDTLLKYSEQNRKLTKEILIRANIGKILSFKSLEWWMKKADMCFSEVKNNNSIYITLPSGVVHYFKEMVLREKMNKYIDVKFEMLELPITKEFDYYLRHRYGDDYMVVPSEANREKHSLIAFYL